MNPQQTRAEEKEIEGKSFGKVFLKIDSQMGVSKSATVKKKPANDAFLICRVRNAAKEVLEENQSYVDAYNSTGKKMYYPPVDTDQSDPIGFNICDENREGIRKAKEIHVKLDRESRGSVFDLGMAFGLGKPIVLVNEPEVREREKDSSGRSYGKLLLWLDQQRRLLAQDPCSLMKWAKRQV